jgi:hypothetical protein
LEQGVKFTCRLTSRDRETMIRLRHAALDQCCDDRRFDEPATGD